MTSYRSGSVDSITHDHITSTPPTDLAATDVVLAALLFTGGTGRVVTPPAGFTLLGAWDCTTDMGIEIYRAAGSAAAPWTFTLDGSETLALHTMAFIGADLQNPIDEIQGTEVASTTELIAPSLVPTFPAQLLVTFHAVLGAGLLTVPTGMVERHASEGGTIGLASNTMAWFSQALVPTGHRTEVSTVAGVGIVASVLFHGNLGELEQVVEVVAPDAQEVMVYAV